MLVEPSWYKALSIDLQLQQLTMVLRKYNCTMFSREVETQLARVRRVETQLLVRAGGAVVGPVGAAWRAGAGRVDGGTGALRLRSRA